MPTKTDFGVSLYAIVGGKFHSLGRVDARESYDNSWDLYEEHAYRSWWFDRSFSFDMRTTVNRKQLRKLFFMNRAELLFPKKHRRERRKARRRRVAVARARQGKHVNITAIDLEVRR